LGEITKAVLKSIETGGKHWLILDEINRGDPAEYLDPLLGGISLDSPYVEHRYMFPNRVDSMGRVPIPPGFRIIGTMNTLDRDSLYGFSTALSRRLTQVPVLTPPASAEFTVLEERALKPVFEKCLPHLRYEEHRTRLRVPDLAHSILRATNAIRSLGDERAGWAFRHCSVGTGVVINVAKVACRRLFDRPPENEPLDPTLVAGAVDVAFATEYLGKLSIEGSDFFEALLEAVFTRNHFPGCHDLLAKSIRRQKAF